MIVIDSLLMLYMSAMPDTSLYFSVRTPKENNPLDYLLTAKYSAEELYSVSLGLERELGKYYSAQEYWGQLAINNWIFREYFIDNYKFLYNQIDIRYRYDFLSVGYAYRHGNKLIATTDWKYKKWRVFVEGLTEFKKVLWKINLGYKDMELVFRSPDYLQFHIKVF